MNCAIARSSRASAPFSTTKREPDNFAARAKSIWPSFSPIASCGSGAKLKRGGSPTRRISRFALSSGPSGTSSAGRFGRLAKSASICWRNSAVFAAVVASASLLPSTWRSSASIGSPRDFAPPISRDRRLRAACASCAAVSNARHSLSSASTCSAQGGRPRRSRPRSKASGFSRIQRRSCMSKRLCRRG